MPETGTRVTLKVKSKQTAKVTFNVSSLAAYSFDLFRNNDFRNTHGLFFQFNILAFRTKTQTARSNVVVQPGPGHFDSIQTLLTKINAAPHFDSVGHFSYVAGKVRLDLKKITLGILKSINFGGLQHHLGFDKATVQFTTPTSTLIAERPPDMTRGTHNFFIYSSLVKNVPINEQMVPLLAVLDATAGEYGQQVQHHVRAPVYVDCIDGPQQKVEISIADDTGNIDSLLQGNTLLTLAIRDA
jgi:hypothetical protein